MRHMRPTCHAALLLLHGGRVPRGRRRRERGCIRGVATLHEPRGRPELRGMRVLLLRRERRRRGRAGVVRAAALKERLLKRSDAHGWCRATALRGARAVVSQGVLEIDGESLYDG